MTFLVRALDKPGHLDIRKTNRESHLTFLDTAGDRLKLAGPLLSEQGEMIGSLLVVDFDTLEAVHDWLADDPYTKAGLFREVNVTGFRPVIARFGEV
ncbi:YciI family protein [Hyphobacterium sp. HN65]|uniref:YciI family protein n=1 Tax=Hyphobacterium lacteum TaxID=3116575 RepID=A0ABU7LRP8_9PROT|nr:YciI family protein [Hyphobacterium sp. HN65]MEE2526581.1 YciI family protein [Hyphobacterium sp. HN65]